ncbi:MAG: VanZ family protein [Anaerohalosphaera sp.]|nr:VanZ family protein [Anaerohalosphaera sp.]
MLTVNNKKLTVAAIAVAVVMVLTHIPQEKVPASLDFLSFDKLLHIIVYAVITILALQAVVFRRMIMGIVCVIIVLALICVVDEITQPMFNRSCSLADYLADLVGILSVSAVYYVRKKEFGRADKLQG